MVTTIFNQKKNRFSPSHWAEFKIAAKKAGVETIQTGKSKFMFYIKTESDKEVWKEILGQGVNFDYVPGGSSKNVEWNSIKVKLNPKPNKTDSKFANDIKGLVKDYDKFTRSDLQGVVQAIAMKKAPADFQLQSEIENEILIILDNSKNFNSEQIDYHIKQLELMIKNW